MNLLDLYEMKDPRDAYQRDVDNSRVGMNRQSRADVTGEEEPSGVFTVVIDGKPWKTGSSNEMFALAGRIANKHTDKKVSVKWPTGELNTVRPQGVAEAEADSDGHSVDHADSGEYDYEGDQAKDQLNTIVRAARRLDGMLDDNENMPEWVQMKITNAADYIDTAADYIESNQEPELAEGDKIGNMDADKFDAAMARLKQLAGAGPLKTVYDPTKRVYRNVPVAVQPKK